METNTAVQTAQEHPQAPQYLSNPLHQYAAPVNPAQPNAQAAMYQPYSQQQYAAPSAPIQEHPRPVAYQSAAPQQYTTAVPGQAAVPQQVNAVQTVSPVVSAGIFGFIVAGTGAMGYNLHRVQDGEMNMTKAVAGSVLKGAAGGTAAAGATAAAASLTTGGTAGLLVTLAAATGISYLLSK